MQLSQSNVPQDKEKATIKLPIPKSGKRWVVRNTTTVIGLFIVIITDLVIMRRYVHRRFRASGVRYRTKVSLCFYSFYS